jgi:O-antigen ligase
MAIKSDFLLFSNQRKSILDYWIIGSALAMLVGLIYSRFLFSLGMVGFSLTLLMPRKGIWVDTIHKALKDRPAFLGSILIFAGVCFSGLNSEDLPMWMKLLRLKLPFLTLPLAIVLLPPIRKEWYSRLIKAFILLCFISSFPVLTHYALNFDAVNEALGQGIPMKTPSNHIRYSLFIAFASLSSTIFWWQSRQKGGATSLFLIIGVFLVLYLHILAVRSGLGVFYLSCFFISAFIIFRYKLIKAGLAIFLGIVVMGLVSIRVVPSLFRKVGYVKYDYMMYQKGEGKSYSDSERIASYKVGLELFKKNPILGTGLGDLKNECEKTYEALSIETSRINYPHNQYLFTLAGMGVIGLAIFLLGTCWPFFFHKARDPLFWVLHLTVFTSFLVENTLERSIGIGFYLLFLLAALAVDEVTTQL